MPTKQDAGQKSSPYWAHEAKGIVRAELDRRGITYARLAKMLQARDIQETMRSLANKISRGSFSFVFFLQVMRALEVKTISLVPTEKAEGVLHSGQPSISGQGSHSVAKR